MEPLRLSVEKYAEGMAINLYAEYTAEEASSLLKVGINRLRAAKNTGELPYISVGVNHAIFLGMDLIIWKLSKRTKSETTIYPEIEMVTGVQHTTTAEPSKGSQQAYALNALKKQSQS